MADAISRWTHAISTSIFMFLLALIALKFFFFIDYFQWVPGVTVFLLGLVVTGYYIYHGVKYQWFDGEYRTDDVTTGLGVAVGVFTFISGIMLLFNLGIYTFVGYTAGLVALISFLLLIPKVIKDISHAING